MTRTNAKGILEQLTFGMVLWCRRCRTYWLNGNCNHTAAEVMRHGEFTVKYPVPWAVGMRQRIHWYDQDSR